MATNRFTNNTLSNQNPIFNFDNLTVLTLEEAVEQIIPIVPDVVDCVSKAKENCNRSSTFLTLDESAAIYLYTMPVLFVSRLNTALRADNRHVPKLWFAFLKLFITALKKLPSTKAIIWRGVNYDATLTLVDDDVHTWWNISSCSMNVNSVRPFLGESGTLFVIDTIHGKDISKFSAVPDEQEVILMPGTRIRRKYQSLSFIDRLFVLHLEEINFQSESQSESNYLFEQIRQQYQRNNRIERIMNPANFFPIEQGYINLAIVKAKEQREKEKQLCNAQHSHVIIGAFEEIYGMKTAIDVKDIFETCKNQEKQVLVFGRAGIGKSTFCRYIAYQWATGSYWPQYELLALIPLRRLTANGYPPDKNYSLIDLVKKEVFPYDLTEKDEIFLKKQFDPKKTLWILDGYDEIIQNVPPHLERLFEQLLKTPHHILTSRPYLNTLPYDVQMEITGFTDENIVEYVRQFFDHMKDELDDVLIKSQTLFSFLKSNPNIWGIAHIPVNLELICSIWSNENLSETKELTITALYSMMTEWLCRRYLAAQNILIQKIPKKEVYKRCQKELSFLESLAFTAMESNSIVIRPTTLEKAFVEANVSLIDHPHILNTGILKCFNKQGVGNQIETDKDHYFVHLSFQEYFAARYLVNALTGSQTEKAIEFIKHEKYNQRYALVFIFAAGLLSESDARSCLNIFWDNIFAEPLDIVGIRHMQLAISCLEDTSGESTLPRRAKLLEWIANCLKNNFSTKDQIISKHLLQSFRRAQSVVCDQTILNVFINLLQCNDTDTKSIVLSFISELEISNPSIAFITSVTNRLDDENKQVRLNACEALGRMGEKAATNEVISKLVSALGDKSECVRGNVCKALGEMGEKAATNEVISKLVSALEDESEHVRRNAYEALGNMGQKAATNEVISKLVSALEDESKYIRWDACIALGKMGQKAATNEVISKLVSALEDESEYVRSSAYEALEKMGEKPATNAVISKLVSALGDESEYVKSSAYEAISKLVSALGDESEYVRSNACEALGNMGEKAATNEVISKLVSALEDESKYVRWDACIALGKMGQKAATNEVISKLMSALGDEREYVRGNACKALGEMGEKAATNEVISKLVRALGDDSEFARGNVCKALGEMGEKAATNEVISKLMSALGDEREYIRRNACKALGEMGEKAATNEVISKLVSIINSGEYWKYRVAASAVGNILSSTAVITELDPSITASLYLCKYASECLKNIAEDELIQFVLSAQKPDLLPSVTHVILLRGGAVTAVKDKVVVYGSKEPLELSISKSELTHQLIEAFADQGKRLHLYFENG